MGERTRLGLWICLPLLAWAAVWTAAFSMPVSDCDGYPTDAGGEEALLIDLVAVASLAPGAAALRVNRVGLLLPVYLLGAAVFAYPLVGLLGLLSSSGIGC